MRTVAGVEERAQCLRLVTRRMGAAPASDAGTSTPPATAARPRLAKPLAALSTIIGARSWPVISSGKVDGLRSAMDLEHSFGPAYVRGRLLKGTAAEAVIGVSEAESGSTVDGVLTLGILWLDHCRQHGDGRRHFGGLKVIVSGRSLANDGRAHGLAESRSRRFQLFTLDERSEELRRGLSRHRQSGVRGWCTPFPPRRPSSAAGPESISCFPLVPPAARDRVEVRPSSATQVGLLLHGLEFARVRQGLCRQHICREDEISFGAGANETPLTTENEPLCRDLFFNACF